MSLYVLPALMALYALWCLYGAAVLLTSDVEPHRFEPPTELDRLTLAYLRDEIDGFDYSFRAEGL